MPITDTYHVTIQPNVADVLANCERLMGEVARDLESKCSDYEQLADARKIIMDMEYSFIRCMLSMLKSTDYDGDLQLSLDGEYAIFFRYTKSGYHGAMIFHATYKDGERQNYGSWSIHT